MLYLDSFNQVNYFASQMKVRDEIKLIFIDLIEDKFIKTDIFIESCERISIAIKPREGYSIVDNNLLLHRYKKLLEIAEEVNSCIKKVESTYRDRRFRTEIILNGDDNRIRISFINEDIW